jgi:hypothetical protein
VLLGASLNYAKPQQSASAVGQYVGSEACQACHEEMFNQFKKTPHPKLAANLLREETTTLCYTCHGEICNSFSLPFRHKVTEGVLSCTDCQVRLFKTAAFNQAGRVVVAQWQLFPLPLRRTAEQRERLQDSSLRKAFSDGFPTPIPWRNAKKADIRRNMCLITIVQTW